MFCNMLLLQHNFNDNFSEFFITNFIDRTNIFVQRIIIPENYSLYYGYNKNIIAHNCQ